MVGPNTWQPVVTTLMGSMFTGLRGAISRNRSILAGSAGGLASWLWWRHRQDSQTDSMSIIDGLSKTDRLAGMDWRPPSRLDLINRLKITQFDLLIIGGGATGTGCALDAASRGLQVACVEKGDFSCGNPAGCFILVFNIILHLLETSSKSTKLVHGGIRYLEKAFMNLDWEQYELVKEALAERSVFLRLAPHLAQQLPIMLPLYKYCPA